MTKNAVLACVGLFSLGILLGGSLGLPLGMVVGHYTPRSVKQSPERQIPSIEGITSYNETGRTPIEASPPVVIQKLTVRLSRDEFTKATAGKMKDEIISAVGRPDRTTRDSTDGSFENWYYANKTFDPTTGKSDNLAVIVIGFGRFNSVRFQ